MTLSIARFDVIGAIHDPSEGMRFTVYLTSTIYGTEEGELTVFEPFTAENINSAIRVKSAEIALATWNHVIDPSDVIINGPMG